MRLGHAAVLAAWIAAAIAGPVARADNRLVIDQVTLEPDVLGGQRLRVFLSATALEGGLLDVTGANTPHASIDRQKLDAPYAIGTYNATGSDTAIVVVTQVSADFTDVLPTIIETFDSSVLAVANDKADRTQVAILTYGESLGPGKLTPVKAARSKIMGLASDGSVGEPALLDSIERALVLLRKATTKPEGRSLRKMIVVIGDGRDASNDRDRVVRVGKRAAKDNVRIHTIAFSPKDIRRPLLLLGELSKQSFGTFRWVRGAKADSWTGAFQQLGAELTRQPVITWFVPADQELAGKKLVVGLGGKGELDSLNEAKVPAAACSGNTCEAGTYCAADRCITPMVAKGRGILGWVFLIGGIVLGALFVLWLIGFVIAKRQALAAQVGVAPPPDMLPGQSHVMPAQPYQSRPPKTMAMSSQPPGPGPGQAAGNPRLYIVSGANAGREIPLKHGFFIGKNAGVDLLIDDGYTSGHHAQFVLDGTGAYRLFDYGSTNGTYVNGQRITDCMLQHGATIKIGSTELRYLAQ